VLVGCQSGSGRAIHTANKENAMQLIQKWDKTFPESEKVDHQKVTFKNRYGITLAADLYQPKSTSGKLTAIAVGGPFGAVKEQSSGLYAQTMCRVLRQEPEVTLVNTTRMPPNGALQRKRGAFKCIYVM
jgi:hypothetical protein